eukprot:scaffold2534_cov21-Tisochrysis_lutea.AAC.1
MAHLGTVDMHASCIDWASSLAALPLQFLLLGVSLLHAQKVKLSDADRSKFRMFVRCWVSCPLRNTWREQGKKMKWEVWPHLSNTRWVHTTYTGLEQLSFSEAAHSDVVLTNSKVVLVTNGKRKSPVVFSISLTV